MSVEVTLTYVDIYRTIGHSHIVTKMLVSNRDLWGFAVPDDAYAFQFYDLKVGDKKVSSVRLNFSPMCYIGGRIMTREQMEAEYPDEQSMITSMPVHGYLQAVRTRQGEFYPFRPGDILINA